MKNAVIAVAAMALVVLAGCNGKDTVKPVVYNGYVVVNNTIGYIRTVDQSVVVTNIDKLVLGAAAIDKGLEIVAKYYSNDYVVKAKEISAQALVILKSIQSDPTQVTDKIAQAIAKLEEARGAFVMINDKLKLGLTFPTPRVLVTLDELDASVTTLDESNEKAGD